MWNEEQRQILTIEVGGRVHKLDPLPLFRRYRAGVQKLGGGQFFQEMLQAILKGEETPEMAEKVMPVLYGVMGWPRFQDDPEHGYTDGEVLIGLTQLLEFFLDSKKKDETLPSSAGSGGDLAESPVTPNTAALSSAEASSNPEGLGITPLVSV